MPKDKDLKRRVRARMQKTGESYTTARAHVVRKVPPALPEGYEQLAGQTDDTMSAKTGRTWPEWVAALDSVGAADKPHSEIAHWVHDQTGLSWWSQAVAVGYERIRGLREVGQRRDGFYEAGKSRTFPVPVADAFEAFAHDERRRRWLDADVTVRKATPHKSVRMTWDDDTKIEVYFTEKGAAKCSVHVQHGKLPTKEAADDAKRLWGERLDALGALLTERAT